MAVRVLYEHLSIPIPKCTSCMSVVFLLSGVFSLLIGCSCSIVAYRSMTPKSSAIADCSRSGFRFISDITFTSLCVNHLLTYPPANPAHYLFLVMSSGCSRNSWRSSFAEAVTSNSNSLDSIIYSEVPHERPTDSKSRARSSRPSTSANAHISPRHSRDPFRHLPTYYITAPPSFLIWGLSVRATHLLESTAMI